MMKGQWPCTCTSTALFGLPPPLPEQIEREANSVVKEQSREAFWEDGTRTGRMCAYTVPSSEA